MHGQQNIKKKKSIQLFSVDWDNYKSSCVFISQKVAGYVTLLLLGCVEKQNKR